MTNKVLISPAFEKGHFYGLVDEGEYLRQSLLHKQILPRTPSRPKTSVNPVILSISSSCPSCASWLQNPFNQRNPRLINDLRLCDGLYNCRKIITNVVSALQIKLFLQNEPNFKKVKLSVTIEMKKDYEQMDTWSIRKNEPKTNPILAQKTTQRTQTNPKQSQSPRPNYGKQPSTPAEDTIQKPLCIFNTYCYIVDQWNPASPPGFTNFNGWISIFCFHSKGLIDPSIHNKIITGESS